MILRRIEITLVGPDDYPEDYTEYEDFHRRERQAMFLFQDHLHIFVQQIRQEISDEYDVEVAG